MKCIVATTKTYFANSKLVETVQSIIPRNKFNPSINESLFGGCKTKFMCIDCTIKKKKNYMVSMLSEVHFLIDYHSRFALRTMTLC